MPQQYNLEATSELCRAISAGKGYEAFLASSPSVQPQSSQTYKHTCRESLGSVTCKSKPVISASTYANLYNQQKQTQQANTKAMLWAMALQMRSCMATNGYARNVGVEKEAGLVFEYNNVNSMLLADILYQATGTAADVLLRERIFDKIGLDDVTLWQDSAGNPLTYCCIDTTARQYSRFGLLFARSGNWNGEQIISKKFVDETFSKVWDSLNSATIAQDRGYSLHWWISRHNDEAVIFNASGKFGQYIFIDRANDIVFTRITKYYPTEGSKQNWGKLKYINWLGSVNFRIALAAFLDSAGIIDIEADVSTPATFESGTSNKFYDNYSTIIDALIDVSQP